MEHELAFYFWSLRDTFVFNVSSIFSEAWYIVLTALPFTVCAFVKQRKRAFVFIITALLAVSVSDLFCYRVLKPAIKRSRPSVELDFSKGIVRDFSAVAVPHKKNYYSMPSNHAANIFAFFMVYFLLIKRYWILLFVNSLFIAGSRIVIVKHYPTDVLAGIVVGIFVAGCFVFIAQRLVSEEAESSM